MAVAALRLVEPPNQPSDSQLIEQTLAGDETAFAALVERYQKKIYRVAFAILRHEADADIVTQDTFVQAYMHLRNFEGRSELETWLTRIAINRARDVLRSRRWISLSADSEESDTPIALEPVDGRPDAERQAMGRQLAAMVERAVARLSSQQRTIFRLRHYEEMSLEKIAEVMGLKSGTVRAHLFRAVHKIRKELESCLPGGFLSEEME